jgi:hypothetical protein
MSASAIVSNGNFVWPSNKEQSVDSQPMIGRENKRQVLSVKRCAVNVAFLPRLAENLRNIERQLLICLGPRPDRPQTVSSSRSFNHTSLVLGD